MIPGQKLTRWFQELVLGRVRSPQDLMRAAKAEVPDAARSSLRFLDIPDDVGWQAPQRLQAPAFILGEAHLKQSIIFLCIKPVAKVFKKTSSFFNGFLF